MFIKSITIKNFRCFENEMIEFKTPDEENAGSGLNIFVGENGCGKTTALEAISFLTENKFALQNKVSINDFQDEIKKIEIEGITDEKFEYQRSKGFSQKLTCSGFCFEANARLAGKLLSYPLTFSNKVISDETLEAQKQQHAVFEKDGLKTDFNIFYFDKNRSRQIRNGTFKTMFEKICDGLNWKFTKEILPKENDEEEIKQKKQENFEKNLENICGEYFQNVSDITQKGIGTKIVREVSKFFDREDFKNIKLDLVNLLHPFSNAFFALREESNLQQIPIAKLGSGIEMIFSLLLLKGIYEKEKGSIIYLIDEPELSLHPQAQKKLLKFLIEESKTKQIFISTHSPYFADSDLIENVFRFENKLKQGVKIYKISEPEKAKDLFHLENREIFFARKILLVEGFEDRIRFRKFLEKYNIQNFFVIEGLKYKGVSEKICKDLNIPFKIIVDLDYLSNEFPPDLNEDELQKITEYKELEKILPNIKTQSEILEKFLREKILPKILKTTDQNGNKIKLCPSSKMVEKIKDDSDYKKRVGEKIEELKSKNIFVLNYGMLENYLDGDGNVKNDDNKKDEKEKELKNIFEIK